jgi:hypothetical protein
VGPPRLSACTENGPEEKNPWANKLKNAGPQSSRTSHQTSEPSKGSEGEKNPWAGQLKKKESAARPVKGGRCLPLSLSLSLFSLSLFSLSLSPSFFLSLSSPLTLHPTLPIPSPYPSLLPAALMGGSLADVSVPQLRVPTKRGVWKKRG